MKTKNVADREPCGCVGLGYAVHFCPLHAHAGELLAACKAVRSAWNQELYKALVASGVIELDATYEAIDLVRAAIAAADVTMVKP